MRYDPAPTSLAIKILSTVVVVVTAGLLAASFVRIVFLLPGGLMFAVTLGCYLRAPVAYYSSRNGLTVQFRVGQKTFGPFLRSSLVDGGVGFTIRLWGNGGLFAGTGIFWNRQWGIFRAYVTTSSRSNLVLVETGAGKVLISPDKPTDFIEKSQDARIDSFGAP